MLDFRRLQTLSREGLGGILDAKLGSLKREFKKHPKNKLKKEAVCTFARRVGGSLRVNEKEIFKTYNLSKVIPLRTRRGGGCSPPCAKQFNLHSDLGKNDGPRASGYGKINILNRLWASTLKF